MEDYRYYMDENEVMRLQVVQHVVPGMILMEISGR